MNFNPQTHKYSSVRNVCYAKNAMVATSQPLAAQAGLDIMKKGGNAIDAAIATAAMLTVVEPTSNGIGSDAFALVWANDKLYGLNGSGYAPEAISVDKLAEKGITEMPLTGLAPVTIPGTPAAWAELSKKFGKLPFKEVLAPAIETARNGYALTPTLAKFWKRSVEIYKARLNGEEFNSWFEVFTLDGRAPEVGEVWKSEDHAKTLEDIADTYSETFYRGDIAQKIAAFSKTYDGYIDEKDLADYYPEWVEPIKVNYRGYDVCEIPPNGQGICALMALNIFKNFNPGYKESSDSYHKLIESMKLAFIDTKEYVADKKFMKYSCEELLSEDYGKQRAALVKDDAIMPTVGKPESGGTVYLCTADSDGNMVSFIQSNYKGFGSGIVIPGTGIALNNRGHNFNLRKGNANCIGPRKKPYHTIIPGFLMKDGKAVGPFGVMGGFMQPQGHFQVVTNMIDYGLNPQDALDAPRWQWTGDKTISVEQSFPQYVVKELLEKGHKIVVENDSGSFGRGQIILRTEYGTLCGGTESRCDGYIAMM